MLWMCSTFYCCYDNESDKLKVSSKCLNKRVLEDSGDGPMSKNRGFRTVNPMSYDCFVWADKERAELLLFKLKPRTVSEFIQNHWNLKLLQSIKHTKSDVINVCYKCIFYADFCWYVIFHSKIAANLKYEAVIYILFYILIFFLKKIFKMYLERA